MSKQIKQFHEALNQGFNPEQRLLNLLHSILDTFSVSRAFLAYPCNPEADYYEIPLAAIDPEYGPELTPGFKLPLTLATKQAILDDWDKPFASTFYEGQAVVDELKEYQVKSILTHKITPGSGEPWLFGVHQCAYSRIWNQNEIDLFTEISLKIEDSLTSYLLYQELKQSEGQYRALFEYNHTGLIIMYRNKALIQMNHAFCDMLGYSLEQLQLLNKEQNLLPELINNFDEIFVLCQNNRGTPIETLMRHKQGYDITTQIFTSIISYQGTDVVLMAILDTTLQKQAEQAQEKNLAVQSAILDSALDGILVVDMDRKVISYNQQFVDIWHIPSSALETGDAKLMLNRASEQMDDPQQLINYVEKIYTEPNQASDDVMQCLDGQYFRIHSKPFFFRQEVIGRVWNFRDITKDYHLNATLNYQASHDELTGLMNRRAFEKLLTEKLEDSKTNHLEHVLCYLDLDQFKLVNDSCGHIAGDELLKQLAHLMHSNVRKNDYLARLGGDEFGILLDGCSLQQSEAIAEKIRNEIANYVFCWDQRQFNIGVSIGITPVHQHVVSVKELLIHADAMCYKAKNLGRNRIQTHWGDDDVISYHKQEMERVVMIQSALKNNSFELWGQIIKPIYTRDTDTLSDHSIHLEILLRMSSESGEPLSPHLFLPVAERYDLATRIDYWVIEHVLDWFSQHPELSNRLSLLSINLSGQSLADKSILTFIKKCLAISGFPATKLCFEITETAAITSLNEARELIILLKQQGCLFALDDFGSGLSSFAYLKNLPVDYLKIDGLFIRDIVTDPIDYAMVKSINEIGHVMGKKTIAEYVESEKILNKLNKLGIDYAQGYHIGRPASLDSLF